VTGVKNDGTRELHGTLAGTILLALEATKIPHKGGVNERLSPCADAISSLLSWVQPADDKDHRRLQGIIPGLIVNGTAERPAGKKGKGRLHGTITLVDNKVLCSFKDYEGHHHTVTCCAPHAHRLQPTAMSFVSYGFI
jgi:hypothetical protein